MHSTRHSGFSDDLDRSVRNAMREMGVVNIPVVAEELRRRHEHQNMALEDVEGFVLAKAQFYGAAMEFDGSALLLARIFLESQQLLKLH